MWLILLFLAMFFVGVIILYVRLTPNKTIKKAKQLLNQEKPSKHEIETTIDCLNLLDDVSIKDECIDLAKKLRAKQRELS